MQHTNIERREESKRILQATSVFRPLQIGGNLDLKKQEIKMNSFQILAARTQ